MSGVDLLDVLVVGAGPTGLTLAAELMRAGLRVRLIDRAPAPARESRATDIHARTLEVFDAIGLAPQIVASGKKVRTFNGYDGGSQVCRLDLSAVDSPFPYTIALPQRETEKLLEAHIARMGGRVERDVSLGRFSQDTGGVHAVVHRGESQERIETRFLVGCDGIGSTVRRRLGLGFHGITYPGRYLVADVQIDWHLPDDQVHLFTSGGGFFNVVALPGPRGVCRVLCDVDEDQARLADLATVQALLDRRAKVRGRVSSPASISSFQIQRRLVSTYRVGRVLLAGDAAHTCSPLLGQGMNLGIQDAWNLGWKLALVARGVAADDLLDTYTHERRPVASAVLFHTDLLHRIARIEGGVSGALRNLGGAMLTRAPPLRASAATLCSALGLSYPASRIVADQGPGRRWLRRAPFHAVRLFAPLARSGPPLSGERAPDCPLVGSRASSLSKLIAGPGHALLLFSGVHPNRATIDQLVEIAARVQRRFAGVVRSHLIVGDGATPHVDAIVDRRNALHRRYATLGGALYLVRPDGYIGFRGCREDGPALLSHLADLFIGVTRTDDWARSAEPIPGSATLCR